MALLLFGPASLAQSATSIANDEIRRCSAVEDSVNRLSCFDALAARLQAAADKAAADAISGGDQSNTRAAVDQLKQDLSKGKWATDISQSKISDTTDVTLQLAAEEAIASRFGLDASKPYMVVRCQENVTAAYIVAADHFLADIEGYGDVTFRIDKRPPFTRSLAESTDNKALGFWNGGSAIPFVKQLLDGSTLLVRLTPFNESSITMEFGIAGLANAIAPLRKACKW